MITNIQVDGFKSLSDFSLDLNRGVNILVGPNGAGKTNIVLFFEFLSLISSQNLSSAISALGGAGSVFRKKGESNYQNSIRFRIHGNSKTDDGEKRLIYEYSAVIGISFEKDDVYYSEQDLKITRRENASEHLLDQLTIDDKLDIHITDNSTGKESRSKVVEFNKDIFKFLYYFPERENGKESWKENFENFLSLGKGPSASLAMHVCNTIEGLEYVRSDFLGGQSFNIVPSKVKEQEDAASAPGIRKDGSGLATTLYAMKKGRPRRGYNSFPFYSYRNESYEIGMLSKIVSYLKLANNTIEDLDVFNDQFDNRLVVRVHVGSEGYKAVLPLSGMSDGTLKWLTLIAAIMTSETIFSIEEPENYLHPWMQAEIVNIMREHIAEKDHDSFVLMTTHSESLLNHAKASELVVVDFSDGSTNANRLTDIDLIESEISNSGFGLGSFYIADALHYEK